MNTRIGWLRLSARNSIKLSVQIFYWVINYNLYGSAKFEWNVLVLIMWLSVRVFHAIINYIFLGLIVNIFVKLSFRYRCMGYKLEFLKLSVVICNDIQLEYYRSYLLEFLYGYQFNLLWAFSWNFDRVIGYDFCRLLLVSCNFCGDLS